MSYKVIQRTKIDEGVDLLLFRFVRPDSKGKPIVEMGVGYADGKGEVWENIYYNSYVEAEEDYNARLVEHGKKPKEYQDWKQDWSDYGPKYQKKK